MVSESEYSDASSVVSEVAAETKKQKKRVSKVEKKSKKPKRSAWNDSDSEIEEPKKKSKAPEEVKSKVREDEEPRRSKKRSHDSDSEMERSNSRFSDSDDDKPKKRVKVSEEPRRKSKKHPKRDEESDEEPKRFKKHSKHDEESDGEDRKSKKAKKETAVDFDELRAYGADIFMGVTKPMTYADDEVEPKDVKQILTTLMNQCTKMNDDLARTNYVKSVYLMSQVLMHGKGFSGEATTTFDEYLNSLEISSQGKWTWPEMTEELPETHFNYACETVFLSLYQPRMPSPFQEFLSEKNRKDGFRNLLPYVDLSRKKGSVAPQSNGVHAGIGLQGHYCMLAKNVKQAKFEMAYPLVESTALSEHFRGTPPIKIHCGNNNDQVKIGSIDKFIMIMGGFAEVQITSGPQSQKLLRQRALVAVKVGYESSLTSNFKKYLKKYTHKEEASDEEEEQ